MLEKMFIKKKKIVFVCLGNICRSPMAEAIMKEIIKEKDLESLFLIDSKATSYEELGNPVYYLAKEKLEEKGINNFYHRSQVFEKKDYSKYDYIVAMDDNNVKSLLGIVNDDSKNKIRKLLPNHNIADPWYTGNFELTYQEIKKGCLLLLDEITEKLKREGEV